MQNFFESYIKDHINILTKSSCDRSALQKIQILSQIIIKTISSKNNIFFAGNGGSAAEAQHMAAELIGKLNFDRPGIRAVALTTDTSVITSIANDYGYENIFSRQIETLCDENDLLIVYSTSGKSKNILKAIEIACKKKLNVIGFSGCDGFNTTLPIYEFKVSSNQTTFIQEVHNIIGHSIFSYAEKEIFKN